MELAITQVPFWLSILFILAFTIPVWLIASTARTAYRNAGKPEKQAQLIYQRTLLFYTCFLGLIALVSLSGFFEQNTLPPRILVSGALPLLLFYFLYVWRSSWFKVIFTHASLAALVSIHLFRFIGIFFLLAYQYGALPRTFALVGGIGDILTAILAIPLIYALRQKRSYAHLFAWIWSLIGLADIISVLRTAVVLTQASIETDAIGVAQFGTFPFSWIPAFAPATIIFLHVVIVVKLAQETKAA
ncbi:MAG: hypothetical protein Sapg2KO_25170 [Saprospiraceae bacterium]